MALPLWDQLEKSQDDNETIEEAIDRIVAEHNSDTEAHLGDDESLESHKAEPVIDHPAGSVVADKNTMTELYVSTIFESLDAWSVSGQVDPNDVPGVSLYIESGAVESSRLRTSPQVPKNFRDSNFDMLFQVLLHFDLSNDDFISNFGYFLGNNTSPTGFGFVFDGDDIFGYVKTFAGNDSTDPISISISSDHVYRAFYDATLEQVIFHVDGQLVEALDLPGGLWQDDVGPQFYIENTASNDGNMRIGELNFSRAI
jgi:hypothetical protein